MNGAGFAEVLQTAASPSVADGISKKIDRRSVEAGRVVGWITTLLLTGLLSFLFLLLYWTQRSPDWVYWSIGIGSSVIVIGAAAVAHLGPELRFQAMSYRVDSQGIEIRDGILWRRNIAIPRSRIQHTDVSQGPIERLFGLATLIIHTAGTHQASVGLVGLDRQTALRIRDYLVAEGTRNAV